MNKIKNILREPYIWVCITSPLIGLAIIGAARYADAAKEHILAAKAEADRHFEARNYKPAIAGYDGMIARSRGSRDAEIRAASEEAEQRRALAVTTLAEIEAAEKRRADQARAALLAESERASREAAAAQLAADSSSASPADSTTASSDSYRSWNWTAPNTSSRSRARTTPRTDPPPTPPYLSDSPGYTATGIPLHVGPRGGIYHYSKSGKKVYHSRRRR